MIVTRGLGRDTVDGQHGTIVAFGLGRHGLLQAITGAARRFFRSCAQLRIVRRSC